MSGDDMKERSRTESDEHAKMGVPRRKFLTASSAAGLTIIAGCGGDSNTESSENNGDGSNGNDGGSNTSTGNPGSQVGSQVLEVGQTTELPDVAQLLANQWSEIGVDWQLESYSFGSMIGRVYNDSGDFEDTATTPWGSSPDRIDPNFYLSTFTSDSGVNIAGYSNEQYDELFTEQQAATNESERSEIISEMQTILHEDMPSLNIIWPKSVFPVNSRLWDIESTNFIGARPTGTMTVISAEPTSQNESDRLVVGGQQTLNVPNPLSPSSNDLQYLLKLAYDTPRRINTDGEAENWAIESLEYQDQTTLDLTLREGMTWHDGEPVTGDDLRFTFDFLSEYTFPKYDPYTNIIDSTAKQTDRTVRVSLKRPNTTFTFSALSFIKLLPEHIWSSVPDQVEQPVDYEMPVEEMIGSGPFEISDLTDQELRMQTFSDHFYDVAYDEFFFVNRASNEAIRADFEAQNIHLTTASPPATVTNALVENDYLRKAVSPSVFPMLISFNTREQPLQSKAFRRALYHATDAQAISQVIYGTDANPSDGTMVHPELSLGTDELADIGPANIEQARQVLLDAGFTYDSNDNLRYPDDVSTSE